MKTLKQIVKGNATEFLHIKDFFENTDFYLRGWNQKELSESYGYAHDEANGEFVKTDYTVITVCDSSIGWGTPNTVFSFDTKNGLGTFSDEQAKESAKKHADILPELTDILTALVSSPELLLMWDKCRGNYNYYAFDEVTSVDGDFDKMEWVYTKYNEIRLHIKTGRVTTVKRTDSSNPYVRHNMD